MTNMQSNTSVQTDTENRISERLHEKAKLYTNMLDGEIKTHNDWRATQPFGFDLQEAAAYVTYLIDSNTQLGDSYSHSFRIKDDKVIGSYKRGCFYDSDEGPKHTVRDEQVSCSITDFETRLDNAIQSGLETRKGE